MNISVYSRKEIEALIEGDFPQNTAVISFYDPKSRHTLKGYSPVEYKGKCTRLFQVCVHDIDIDLLPEYGLTYETFLPEADSLAEFIVSAINDGLDIICQCDYGQSRSAGCAAAIREYYDRSGIRIFADYRYYPSQLIFNKVYDALEASGAKEK